MDHSKHSAMSTASSSEMHMKMWFNTDLHYTLLFGPWNIDTVGKAVGACLGSFLFAIIYEALEALRQHLLLRASCNNRCIPPMNESLRSGTPLAGPSCPACPTSSETGSNKVYVGPTNAGEDNKIRFFQFKSVGSFFNSYHLIQTFLHMLHVFMGYMLMLIVMTYNVYLLLSIVFGFTLGYFLFAQKRALLLRSHNCCH